MVPYCIRLRGTQTNRKRYNFSFDLYMAQKVTYDLLNGDCDCHHRRCERECTVHKISHNQRAFVHSPYSMRRRDLFSLPIRTNNTHLSANSKDGER